MLEANKHHFMQKFIIGSPPLFDRGVWHTEKIGLENCLTISIFVIVFVDKLDVCEREMSDFTT